MSDFSGLTVQGAQAYAKTLSNKSEELREETTNASNELKSLLESNAFKTLIASTEFMTKIETLSANCGKFSDGVDVFAKFLIDKVIDDFGILDEQTLSLQQELDERLNELSSVSELGGGTIDSSQLDFSKISSTAGDAASGDFIQEGNVHKEYWEGELQLVPREDGTIQIVKDGTVMGYTTEEGVDLPDATDEAVTTSTEEMSADLENGTAGEASVGTSDASVATSSISNGKENYPSQVNLETAKNWSPEQVYTYMENGGTIYDSQTGNTLDSSMMDKNAALFNDFTNMENTSSNSISVSAGDGTTIESVGTIIDPGTGRFNTDIGSLASNHDTIPFPKNAELVRPGVALNFDNTAGAFESLVYNSDTNKYDLVNTKGEVYTSFSVEDMDEYYFKSNNIG